MECLLWFCALIPKAFVTASKTDELASKTCNCTGESCYHHVLSVQNSLNCTLLCSPFPSCCLGQSRSWARWQRSWARWQRPWPRWQRPWPRWQRSWPRWQRSWARWQRSWPRWQRSWPRWSNRQTARHAGASSLGSVTHIYLYISLKPFLYQFFFHSSLDFASLQ